MTRAVRDRILKDANGDISDHLRNHIHLTNCIHLKNHMHKQSPILSDRSIVRDLVVLQRSRSLRDPSMSPPSWNSPSASGLVSKRGDNNVLVGNGRWSVGIDRHMDGRGSFESSPPLPNIPMSDAVHRELEMHMDEVPNVSGRSRKGGVRERRRSKREESVGRYLSNDLLHGKDDTPVDQNVLDHDTFLGNAGLQSQKHNQKGRRKQVDHPENVHKVQDDSDDVASSHNHHYGRHAHYGGPFEEAQISTHDHFNGRNRGKRRKFRGARKTRNAVAAREAIAQYEMSVASNSLAHCAERAKYQMEESGEEYGDPNVTKAPGNGCGPPWNWSRIHHRGKSFLDIAGKSLSCGLSDSKSRKGGSFTQGAFPNMPVGSDPSSSSGKFDGEALPLLIDDQDSADNAAWVHDYSGELGIYADNLLKQDIDSDLASEARSGNRQKFQLNQVRHQNLTQKYMPRTFKDLVGQNLISQALSNAVVKKKVGSLYVFYGPHGTGKTSCARIFARALNCQSLEHPKPCGVCVSCTAHDKGRNQFIQEVGAVSAFDYQSIVDILNSVLAHRHTLPYKILIFDDCDTLSTECWSAISKVMDRGPRRVVFVLVCSSLDVLPHMIISRCQKFFFPKLKDADIIYTLQWIATKEDLEIDKDAVKLIASRSDGSLRDAEMTLDQLSLLGQKISILLVQELVGLVSDEKLVDLLDLAFSADTVNIVKNLREIMESGVEPLALMSQLATVITDILAGSYDIMKGGSRRKFFRRQPLSKEDMKKLRHALKTLSEAEKQLRMSNDRLTWLTAALLQLAPDQQYNLPSSSAETSFNQSPLALNTADGSHRLRSSYVQQTDIPNNSQDREENDGVGMIPQRTFSVAGRNNSVKNRHPSEKFHREIEDIWLEVLEKIHIKSIREFLYQEGQLVGVSFGAAGSTVHLTFSSHLMQSKAEKYMAHILQAFESVLGSPVKIEIKCESRIVTPTGISVPLVLPASQETSRQVYANQGGLGINRMPMERFDDTTGRSLKDRDNVTHAKPLHIDSTGMGKSEIVEIEASPRQRKDNGHFGNMQSAKKIQLSESNQNKSIVKRKVSLAHIIQQTQRGSQRTGWSKRKAISIAEKLEQENLRLEPRSRSYLCWKASRLPSRRLLHLKVRPRKPKALLKFVSCGKCMSARSPR
ncbi:protein STICHEL-like 3 isoform X1 [Daucus carota subsp. sativus]|uniref:protein STICHEL-like 3 isoform X1 n=1 Tax=Daucus carota subsp. sativus TaxID=79200 RepID=UPI0007EFD1C4|nr:PREDICTED: protein STICHEL-like 3 isoform X1 [Daucus carota subsp. sativus]